MGIAAAAQINRIFLKLYWGIGEMLFLCSMIYLLLFLKFYLRNFLPGDSDCGLRANGLRYLRWGRDGEAVQPGK